MDLVSKIFDKETVSELIEDTQHEIAKELSDFKKYCRSFARKMKLVHDFSKERTKASFDAMESEIRSINRLVRAELRLEAKEEHLEKAAEGKVDQAIQEETDLQIKSKLKKLKQDLIALFTVIEHLKSILLGQLKFLDDNKKNVRNAGKNFDDFVELVHAEYALLGQHGVAGQNELNLLHKTLKELMQIKYFKTKSNKTYKLPVPHDDIHGFGMIPVIKALEHPGEHQNHAWDFAVPEGTPVFAARDGTVVYAKLDSEDRGSPQKYELLHYLWIALQKQYSEYAQKQFLEFIRKKKNQKLMNWLYANVPSAKKNIDKQNLELAIWEISTFYGQNANTVVIKHGKEYSAYIHLLLNKNPIAVGQKVKKGDIIAYSGDSGFSGGPHLHFEVFIPETGVAPSDALLYGKRKSIPVVFEN